MECVQGRYEPGGPTAFANGLPGKIQAGAGPAPRRQPRTDWLGIAAWETGPSLQQEIADGRAVRGPSEFCARPEAHCPDSIELA